MAKRFLTMMARHMQNTMTAHRASPVSAGTNGSLRDSNPMAMVIDSATR